MQKMNSSSGHYWWSSLLGLFSILSLQDYVFILGALVSVVFTIKTYYANRKEKRQSAEQDKARTQLLKEYLQDVRSTQHPDKPRTATVITEALRIIEDECTESE